MSSFFSYFKAKDNKIEKKRLEEIKKLEEDTNNNMRKIKDTYEQRMKIENDNHQKKKERIRR